MGWTVLYIAFGMVALWLLGEVMLQHKARLRWRLLAFVGFLTVVVGVVMPSIVVIVLGAIAFAVGQTYVTLSFRKGFTTGWAIGARPGASRRRRGGQPQRSPEGDPHLQVSEVEGAPVPRGDGGPGAAPADATAVYEPQPLPDDTGQYGVYDDTSSGLGAAAFAAEGQGGHTAYAPGYDAHAGYEQPAGHDQPGAYAGYGQDGYAATGQDGYAAAPQDAYQGNGQETYAATGQDGYVPGPDGYPAQHGQDGYGYGYAAGQQQYPGYPAEYGDQQGYATYDAYGTQTPYQDPYAPADPYAGDTPPGGVWVPQQRDRQVQEDPSGYEPGYGYPQQDRQGTDADPGSQYRF